MTSKILNRATAFMAISILLSVSNALCASKWVYLFKAKELDETSKAKTFTQYYDINSVKFKPPYTSLIIKAVLDEPLIDYDTKKPYKYTLLYFRINCTKKLYLVWKFVNYSSTGRLLSSANMYPLEFSSVYEDPNVVRIAQKFCKP